ncbi:MAG: SpoIIE family protein phosphatase, partial [Bacteroidota bacterium]
IVVQDRVLDPAEILEKLHVRTIQQLHQENSEFDVPDGMDVGLVAINRTENILKFAGAKRPLVYLKNGELDLVKGNRRSIGGLLESTSRSFSTVTLDLFQVDQFFLFSDGYTDQYGGPKNKKFKSKALYALFEEIAGQTISKQRERLEQVFEEWKWNEEQIDDVLVVGVKLDAIDSGWKQPQDSVTDTSKSVGS